MRGKTISHYKILEKLGEVNMGYLYSWDGKEMVNVRRKNFSSAASIEDLFRLTKICADPNAG